jgi:carbon-monoxide dehydrogenase medium subunit
VIDFEYLAPRTMDEALDALSAHREHAKVLAGGQSLVPLLAYRLARPGLIVDLGGLDLAGIASEDRALRLGALVRHCQLEASETIARRCPILGEAAALIGNVRVRSLGTLGGSLAHADPAAELPMVLTALDARLTLRSAAGARTIGAADFFQGYLTTALAPDELLIEAAFDPLDGSGYAVEEFSRRAGDFAIVAVAALVTLDARGRVEEGRLAFGGVGATPLRAPAAEDLLRGHEPTPDRIARASAVARDGLAPESDAFASASYRRLLARVLARRALGRAVARALSMERGSTRQPGGPTATGAAPWPATRGEPAAGGGSARRERDPNAPAGPGLWRIALAINGRARDVDVRPSQTLLEVLRDTLGIFDAKEGCGEGACGTCTVLLDGRPVSSCLVLALSARGRSLVTVRGIEREGGLHPLQETFVRHGAVQCGFCTPGMLLTALAFLEHHPLPSRHQIRSALEGNLCRCTGYTKIVDAVEAYVRGATHG